MNTPRPLTRRALLGALLVSAAPNIVDAQAASSIGAKRGYMKIRVIFQDHEITATLDDSPTVRDFASMLPLSLTFEDYSTNEKIAYLPRKLTEKDSGTFSNEASGDVAYFAPWGNIIFYHGSYSYWPGLIRLGRVDGNTDPLLAKGSFPLRIEHVN
jgi:hypothetical protein